MPRAPGLRIGRLPSAHDRLESTGMLDAIITFFSSFNPIVFAAFMSLGAIILYRRPAQAQPLHVASEREHGHSGSIVRRP